MKSKQQVAIIKLLLKFKIISIATVMWIAHRSFSAAPRLGDPISDPTTRGWWAFLALFFMIVAIAGFFSHRRFNRFLGVFGGAIYMLALSVTYMFILPITLGLWFLAVISAGFMAIAGIVYFLPENLQSLIDLNDNLHGLESEIIGLRQQLRERTRD